jgi:kinesin family protein 6/9
MIATCSIEKANIDESISTCRFAQRVALIKNDATLNEEVDPKLMVARLKQQVLELKEELSLATGKERNDALSQEDLDWCKEQVETFVKSREKDAKLSVGSDMRMINYSFKLLKMKIVELLNSPALGLTQPQPGEQSGPRALKSEGETHEQKGHSDVEWQRMKSLLKQRDDEINILVKMLKQEKKRAAEAEASVAAHMERTQGDVSSALSQGKKEGDSGILSDLSSRGEEHERGKSGDSLRVSSADEVGTSITSQKRAALKAELSKARQEAFEIFRRDYSLSDNLEKQKRELKAKYAEAKSLGEQVNASRLIINQLKSQIEKIRVSRAVLGESSEEPDEREEELRHRMEEEKTTFKQVYHTLKGMKAEIEHSQHLLEKGKVQLQKDFEVWWEEEAKKMRHQSSRASSRPSSRKSSKSKHHLNVFPPDQPLQMGSHGNSPIQRSFSEKTVPLGPNPHVLPSTGSSPYQPGLPGATFSHTYDGKIGSSYPLSATNDGRTGSSSYTPSVTTSTKSSTPSHSSSTSHSSGMSATHGSIPLTGDRRADADIIAFYKARQKLIERGLKRTS